MEAEGLVGLVEIVNARFGNAKKRQRARQQIFDRLDPVGRLIHRAQAPAFRPGAVSDTSFTDFARQRTHSIERQLPGPMNAVHGRGLPRQLDKFPAFRGNQQTIIRLKISSYFSKRRQFIRRVEVEKGTKAGVLYRSDQRWVRDVSG